MVGLVRIDELDASNAVKQGRLWMSFDGEWAEHYVVLEKHHLIWYRMPQEVCISEQLTSIHPH